MWYEDWNIEIMKTSNLCLTGQNETCTFSVSLSKELKSPVYIYFNYDKWFTSYFVYAKSFLISDLVNKELTYEYWDSCYPVKSYQDFVNVMSE